MNVHVSSTVSKIGVSQKWIAEQITKLAKELKLAKTASVSVICVGEAKMKTLHGLYSGEPTVTDVLSFPGDESYDTDWYGELDETELGEIVLCIPQIAKQAKAAGHGYKTEMNTMFAHGMLHLLGYDHQNASQKKEMYTLQEKLVYTIERKKRS